MTSSETDAITRTLEELSSRPMSNGEVLRAMQQRHPGVSTSEIAHAAFFAVTDPTRTSTEMTSRIYDFALEAGRIAAMDRAVST